MQKRPDEHHALHSPDHNGQGGGPLANFQNPQRK